MVRGAKAVGGGIFLAFAVLSLFFVLFGAGVGEAAINERISFGFVWPTGGTITSKWGWRFHPVDKVWRFHSGLDIAAPLGTPIVAVNDGTVVVAASGAADGLYLVIDHGSGVKTSYSHCSFILVKPGQKVIKGQQIAMVGSTGKSTGSHLHFGVKVYGEPIDPEKFLLGSPGAPGQSGGMTFITDPTSRREPILEKILKEFMNNRDEWLGKMADNIQRTFFLFLLIAFIWEAAMMGVGGELSFGDILRMLITYSIYGGLFKWIFANPLVLNSVIDSFIKLSEAVTKYDTDVFNMLEWADNITETLWVAGAASFANAGFWEGLLSLFTMTPVWIILNIAVIAVMFLFIVGQLVVAIIEGIMITTGGFVLLVFDGLKGMFDYWKTYLRGLIACGMKLFLLGCVCGAMQKVFDPVLLEVSVDSPNGFMISLTIISGILSALSIIASNVSNVVHTTLGFMSGFSLRRE